ncbi:hypothetical protein [Pseudoflavonifractor phocaeensis]|uniref:hypothetical protein n=1 Tax=Pseudoflavonifractor phocaeensis TaxID=1870988 RepID=UPI00210963E4|nr:hypothetical protein [Pseudoflavonifractor phocaeensis]MCQ4863442.1 hypothetical protein [Pseudoflavonifractor phocaeensis]
MCKRIISLLLVLVTLFPVLIVPAFATAGDAVDYVIDNFWGPFSFDKLKGLVKSFLADDKTPETATESDWQNAYKGFVNDFKSTNGSALIDDGGYLYLALSHKDSLTCSNINYWRYPCEHGTGEVYPYGTVSYVCGDSYSSISIKDFHTVSGNSHMVAAKFRFSSPAPVSGYYSLYSLPVLHGVYNNSSGTGLSYPESYYNYPDLTGAEVFYSAGAVVETELYSKSPNYIKYGLVECVGSVLYRVRPTAGLLDVPGTAESRPGSLTGITYGYQNDTGEIIVYVAKDSGMFNEEGGYLYNPITGKTLQADSWYYDYENRRYDIALANNQGRATLEYGDDGARITIVDSGNVTNIYNYYYMTPKDEPVDPPPVDPTPTPTPKPCTHSYTSAVTELPTCLIPGVRSYICMLCGDTYTEPVSAIGHIWVVRETVNASYDDNGNLLQAGYTIYKCSKCGTEHKDTADVGPPGNGGGGGGSGGFPGDTDLPDIPGSSDEEDGFNIFDIVGSIVNALWSLISGLFSTIFGGVVGFFTSLGSGISGFFSAFSGQNGVFGFATYGGADIWD